MARFNEAQAAHDRRMLALDLAEARRAARAAGADADGKSAARLAQLKARLKALPAAPRPAVAKASYMEAPMLTDGKPTPIRLDGQIWHPQTPRIVLGSDGSVTIAVKGGENAAFDYPDMKKIRTELSSASGFGPHVLAVCEGEIMIRSGLSVRGLEWMSVLQAKNPDMRYEAGNYDGIDYADGARLVRASPMGAVDILYDEKDGREYVSLRGDTSTDMHRDPVLDADGVQKRSPPSDAFPNGLPMWKTRFAPQQRRPLGRTPLIRDKKIRYRWELIDSRGAPGGYMKLVWDGVVVFEGALPTGYGYVDALQAVPAVGADGKAISQPTQNYWKKGGYGGSNVMKAVPPTLGLIVSYW